MIVLIKALPRDALVRTPEVDRGRDPWTAELELMAQLVELTSIGLAQMRLRKPLKVPRPARDTAAKAAAASTDRGAVVSAGTNPYRAAIAAFSGSRPARLRGAVDAGPAEQHEQHEQGGGSSWDPAYRAAIRAFGAAQPRRLRAVGEGEQAG